MRLKQYPKILVIFFIIVLGLVGYFMFIKENNYSIDGIEDGGYNGTAFCNLINRSRIELKNHSIAIDGEGPYTIKINKMRYSFSPYEYPSVKLNKFIRFENKDISYADGLYFGNDNNLYSCHGGK